VALVALLAGLLFTVNARLSGDKLGDGPGLRGMVSARDQEVAQLDQRHAALEAEIASLLDAGGADASLPRPPEVQIASGSVAVTGPGLEVTLADSSRQAISGFSPELLIVHQQDIDAVLAALWAGGAEAISVQDHRLTATTVVRCVGNVILVGGRVYAPPYRLAAIGPVEAMEQALDDSYQVQAFVESAGALGLGWSVEKANRLELAAAASTNLSLRYAKPTSGKERL